MTADRGQAALIEIVERTDSYDPDAVGAGSLIKPNEVRINGTPLLMPRDEPVEVHAISTNPDDCVRVTLTVWARRVLMTRESKDDSESPLVAYARRELDIVDPPDDAAYGGMLRTAVLELVRVFAEQGHSGMSAGITTSLVEKLLRFEPLSPLTGDDDEWTHLGHDPEMEAQNKRCSHVFRRTDGTAYDSEGRVFEDPDGSRYTSRESRVEITFPYTPTREVVMRGKTGS